MCIYIYIYFFFLHTGRLIVTARPEYKHSHAHGLRIPTSNACTRYLPALKLGAGSEISVFEFEALLAGLRPAQRFCGGKPAPWLDQSILGPPCQATYIKGQEVSAQSASSDS